jgi:hypothetical protein
MVEGGIRLSVRCLVNSAGGRVVGVGGTVISVAGSVSAVCGAVLYVGCTVIAAQCSRYRVAGKMSSV